jgi:hypothetical protein
MRPPVQPETFLTPLHRATWKLIRARPDIYRMFDRFTREKIAKGHRHYSSDAVVHRIRWETDTPDENDTFKISNNHTAYLSRIWMESNPEHAGFFRTQELPGEMDFG